MIPSRYASFIKRMCNVIYSVHDGGKKSLKTIPSRVYSTLDGHPEVTQRRDAKVWPAQKSQATPIMAYEGKLSLIHMDNCISP